MNRREAVVKALMHEKTDRIPYHFEFTTQSSEKMIAYTGDKDFAKPYEGFLHYGQYWGYPTERTDKICTKIRLTFMTICHIIVSSKQIM